MPAIDFSRFDLVVTVHRRADGSVVLTAGDREHVLDPATVAGWLAHPEGAPAALAGFGPLELPQPGGGPSVRRLALDVAGPEIGGLPWEAALAPLVQPGSFGVAVRVVPVRPRVAGIPLTLPVRIVEVDLDRNRRIWAVVRGVFGGRPQEQVDRAILVLSTTFAELEAKQKGTSEPTAEVLHFGAFSSWLDRERVLSTVSPDQPGTLAWLCRLTDTLQTRLVVLDCDRPEEAAWARRLALGLANRGGPAVLVHPSSWRAAPFYQVFYERLVHDQPLDVCLRDAAVQTYWSEPAVALFGGAGREELLRVSTLGQELTRLADDLEQGRPEGMLRLLLQGDVVGPLRELRRVWPDLRFNFHEREGLLPLSDLLQALRGQAGVHLGAAARRAWPEPAFPAAPAGPRHINPRLWREEGEALRPLTQEGARLRTGQTYHLGIQVGPKDVLVRTFGASALVEEFFKWTPEMAGVWLEIGVTGLDFAVLGDPVQELWLPREGPSETACFAVVPRAAGAARLRFCVYHEQDVVQSFRLAALVNPTEAWEERVRVRAYYLSQAAGDPPGRADAFWHDAEKQTWEEEQALKDPTSARRLLAGALDLSGEAVGSAGYLPRLEYSRGGMDGTPRRPARAVSIVANNLGGQVAVTVKGAGYFAVRTRPDLPTEVLNVRKALNDVATPPRPGAQAGKLNYGFGKPGQRNAGDPATLDAALRKLAEAGWELYDRIIPRAKKNRDDLETTLSTPGQVIHVAHVLLDKVIPWAVVYDRPYRANMQTVDGTQQPVGHAACLAALPGADGSLPVKACKQHPDCLLHPDQVRARAARGGLPLLDETVACPLGFWGFRHIVEVPPQQAGNPNDPNAASALHEQVLGARPAQVATAIHSKLNWATDHETELRNLIGKPPLSAALHSHSAGAGEVVANLKALALQVIYLYCHTRGGRADPNLARPQLEFQGPQEAQPGIIRSADLDHNAPWPHHPLVFLNGCSTAAFSPDALSPFIEKLVEDRDAAGVIGTEVPVWEQLAMEVARRFLEAFLAGDAAGDALLIARRALLAQLNPLGLVYTLYASADLRLPPLPGKTAAAQRPRVRLAP
jgi:hypothetical protein